MEDLSMQEMIEKYQKELMAFSKSNPSPPVPDDIEEESIKKDDEYYEDTVPVIANSPSPAGREEPEEITSLEGTNVTGYDAGREERKYDTYEEFLRDNPMRGSLRIQTLTGSETYPSAGAEVEIYRQIGGKDMLIAKGITDESGIYENRDLPAPDISYSEELSYIQPFTSYTVSVNQRGYVKVIIRALPIFPNIESMQTLELIPGNQNGDGDSTLTISSQEPQDL